MEAAEETLITEIEEELIKQTIRNIDKIKELILFNNACPFLYWNQF